MPQKEKEVKTPDPKVNKLMDRKVEMIAKVRALQAEIWKVNQELQKAGADIHQVACW